MLAIAFLQYNDFFTMALSHLVFSLFCFLHYLLGKFSSKIIVVHKSQPNSHKVCKGIFNILCPIEGTFCHQVKTKCNFPFSHMYGKFHFKWSKVQWNRAIWLAQSHKLDPWPLDEGPRPKSGKSRLNHISCMDQENLQLKS